jgi:hypothetical protein
MNPGKPLPALPVWCIAANVRPSHPYGLGAQTLRFGTKKFHPNAKVYSVGGYDREKVIVVGHIHGKRYITTAINTWYLTNFQVEMVYSPTVLERVAKTPAFLTLDGSPEAKAGAEAWVEILQNVSEQIYQERLAKFEAFWADLYP